MTADEPGLRAFAAGAKLADATGHVVEPLTPLLARAAGLRLRPAFRGPLPGGGEGVIGLLGYGAGHALGASSDESFEFLVAITRVPEAEPLVPRLFCRPRKRVESVGGMGFELDDESVWTESEALAQRYEVATSPYQDPNWMRQLFAPAFIDWLVTVPPPSFAFELAYGDLAGSLEAGGDPGALWESTGAVAARIRRECREGTG